MKTRTLYGFHPLREALRRRPQSVSRVLIASNRGGKRRSEIEALCERHRVACQIVPLGELEALGERAAHNGFMAELAQSVAGVGSGGDAELVVLVEDIQDPRNLGALLRVCEGAGVGRVLVRDRGSSAITAVTEKTAAGAVGLVEIERITNPSQTLETLKQDGYWIYGADAAGEAPWTADLTGKVVLCFGGEEKGLRRLTRERCDVLLGLPMRGQIASLNLSTAASAMLYEAVRQRTATPQDQEKEMSAS